MATPSVLICVLGSLRFTGTVTSPAGNSSVVSQTVSGYPFTRPDGAVPLRQSVLATYANPPTDTAGHIDCDHLKLELGELHANSYSFIIMDKDGSDYLDAVRCLAALTGFSVDGVPFTAWLTIVPPFSYHDGVCSTPADSPLTDFNETSLFNSSLGPNGCHDYRAWADVTGRLSSLFPHLRYLNIDDFSLELARPTNIFSQALVTDMQMLLRPRATLVPTVYYEGRDLVAKVASLDGVLFYFMNAREGSGPCGSSNCPITRGAACEWPPRGCLAGQCAESTVANLPGEVHDVAVALGDNTAVFVGVYFKGSGDPDGFDCATPSAAYARNALETALSLATVSGAVVYTLPTPSRQHVGCSGPKRSVAAEVFGSFSGHCPLATPFAMGGTSNSTGLCCRSTTWFYAGLCDGNDGCCLTSDYCPHGMRKCSPCSATKWTGDVRNGVQCSSGVDHCCLFPGTARACGNLPACGLGACPNSFESPRPCCPDSTPFQYGDHSAGFYCCATLKGLPHNCVDQNGNNAACCLRPGASMGCQGIGNCSQPLQY